MIQTKRPQIELNRLDDLVGKITFFILWVPFVIISAIVTKNLLQTLVTGVLGGGILSTIVAVIVVIFVPSDTKYINMPLSRRFRIIKQEKNLYRLESKWLGKWYIVMWTNTIEDEPHTIAELKCAYRELRGQKPLAVEETNMLVYKGRL